jgi:hypothetical protein
MSTIGFWQMAGAFGFLYVEPQRLTFEYDGTPLIPLSGSITINSSANWSISLMPTWMDVSATSGGAGVTIVHIYPQPNMETSQRNGSFTVSNGSNIVLVYITQYGIV